MPTPHKRSTRDRWDVYQFFKGADWILVGHRYSLKETFDFEKELKAKDGRPVRHAKKLERVKEG